MMSIWLIYILAACPLRYLLNIVHECVHATFFSNVKANDRLGIILCVFLLFSFRRYAYEHISHHRYLGDPEKDLDLKSKVQLLHGKFSLKELLTHLKPTLYDKSDTLFINFLRCAWFIVICLFVFPIITYSAFRMLNLWCDFQDHKYFLQGPTCHRHVSRFGLINLLLFPRNDGYHDVHHMFPKAPSKKLPEIAKTYESHPS